jgi:uncharacterized BrkB/YihY/UPF0761 family membrane protein
MTEGSTDEERQARASLLAAWARVAATQRTRTNDRLTTWRAHRPMVDIAARVWERDRSVAGTVLGSAVAFRLFLFFVPTVLFVVGILGALSGLVASDRVSEGVGVSGTVAEQIEAALDQNGSTRWLAVLAGLWGMAIAGRTVTRVLQASSALAWRTAVQLKVGVRVAGTVVGVLVALALMTALVNRARQVGITLAGLSLLGALAVYTVGWLVVARTLPSGARDPAAAIPGAVLVGSAFVVLQAVSQFYLSSQLSGASQLYGALAGGIAVLGWFFIIGRVFVLSFVLDAVVYERFGSISTVVFGLPLLRVLPRRSPRVARFFDLDRADRDGSSEAGETPGPAAPPPR